MKTLSLLQPWATLWALGLKIHETRSWPTNHRGPLAIHASKGKDPTGRNLHLALRDALQSNKIAGYVIAGQLLSILPESFEALPFGAIIGDCTLTGCILIDQAFAEHLERDNYLDFLLGNYTPGRYAWASKDNRLYERPIPHKGSLGLWQYNP